MEGTKLHAAASWPWVAFEVDGVDADGQSGWSVLVTGTTEEVEGVDQLEMASCRRRTPWGLGCGARWVRIVPTKVTGRRISAVARRARACQPSELRSAP